MTRLPFVLRSVLFIDLTEGLSFLLCVITKGDVICRGRLLLCSQLLPRISFSGEIPHSLLCRILQVLELHSQLPGLCLQTFNLNHSDFGENQSF